MEMEFSLNIFIENHANCEGLEEICWFRAPEIDCEGLSTWTEVVTRAVRNKLGRSEDDG